MSEQPATQTGPVSDPSNRRAAGESDRTCLNDTISQEAERLGSSSVASTDSLPSRIGRYRVCRELGRGGFGIVYLAHDDEIDRPVAIKVPRTDRLHSTQAVADLLAEARHVARLKHPNIVTLYDFGQSDGHCYLVSEYIDGINLAKRMQQGPISHEEAALLVAQVADALHYAHGKHDEDRDEVYHRDVKPANILLDKRGRPHLTDFGLAVAQEDLPKQRGRRPGTHPYMSPEQVRGEGHRIDGRTDIYSLGVVLYELLCGRRPFEGDSKEDVFDHILHTDPRPLRQINDAIAVELERICLQALSKQMSLRYATAKDMADELRAGVAQPPPSMLTGPAHTVQAPPSARTMDRPARVLPKGLRSFGPEDSDFFLDLLPGPHHRDGLPDSIRFWKTRIESRDQDQTFAVGLIYGPSGCGKSSLVRSGLLPRLDRSVVPVYLEATRDDTESRLVKAIHKSCPSLGDMNQPIELLAELRHGRGLPDGDKLLIVLDQLEQWLHSHGQQMEHSELVAALRQADGVHVQILLMVRDDFWMGISRLFETLEISLDPERNTRAVDLFDLQHARRVLYLFGETLGRFGPAGDRRAARDPDLSADQRNFLDQAVHELSEDGRVISVRLSLFADLMKERPWTLESLLEVGGAAGVAVRFLEETFSARAAIPERRAIEKPARALLHALLPEPGTEIKGHMRSRGELAAACGLAESSSRFVRLMQILDHELHLITPSETDQGSFYQLTHDYLVPPLRQWLTLERRKTWRGRAELSLEEHTGQMQRWPQSCYVPSVLEYVSIMLAVPIKRRRPEQRALMREATRFHGLRWGGAFLAGLVIVASALYYTSAAGKQSRARSLDSIVSNVLSASPEGLPDALRLLDGYRDIAIPNFQEAFDRSELESTDRLHSAFALAFLGKGQDPSIQNYMVQAIAWAESGECNNFVKYLDPVLDSASVRRPLAVTVAETLQDHFRNATEPNLTFRYATVLLYLGETTAAESMLRLAPDPVNRTAFVHSFQAWHADQRSLERLFKTDVGQLSESQAALVSGLCTAFGLAERRPSDREWPIVRDWLHSVYRDAKDGGAHSAAGWALRKLKETPPPIEPSSGPVDRRRWFINQFNMTMVEIPVGTVIVPNLIDRADPPASVDIDEPFYVLDREVSAELFGRFVKDPDWPDAEKPTDWPGHVVSFSPKPNCPVQNVSWYDAVLFCNWLSAREGRSACYRKTDQKEKMPGRNKNDPPEEWDGWELVRDSNGYRLPTDAEWVHACSARSRKAFSHGDDSSLLHKYGWFAGRSTTTSPGAELLPNGFGVFDMHGNVQEWCWGWHRAMETADPNDPRGIGSRRVLRGGVFQQTERSCQSTMGVTTVPVSRTPVNGFRVVCSCR